MKKTKVINNIIDFKISKEELLLRKKKLSIAERNHIIEHYLPMIQCVARKISFRLPAHISCNDLISSGVIGLMDAIKKYNPTNNNTFKTYAEFRVRGAVLDSLRSQDWTPRSIRDKSKRIQKIIKILGHKLSRIPTDREIAKALGISFEEYHFMLNQTKEVKMVSIDENPVFNHIDKTMIFKVLESSNFDFENMNQKSVHRIILSVINELPERQRIVLSLYYYEECNLRKIGQVLKITESRVSQLHAQSLAKLKTKLMNRLKREDLLAA